MISSILLMSMPKYPVHSLHPRDGPYTALMGRKLKKPRPQQGARLVALRQAAGLSQAELAELVDEPQANIAYWERSEKPPRSDALPKLARVLGVSIEEVLGDANPPVAHRAGPVGQVQKIFEEVRRLPRRQQQKVIDVVAALLEQYRKQAS
jgi:transcriptional regulator with XRE-family HTH domain